MKNPSLTEIEQMIVPVISTAHMPASQSLQHLQDAGFAVMTWEYGGLVFCDEDEFAGAEDAPQWLIDVTRALKSGGGWVRLDADGTELVNVATYDWETGQRTEPPAPERLWFALTTDATIEALGAHASESDARASSDKDLTYARWVFDEDAALTVTAQFGLAHAASQRSGGAQESGLTPYWRLYPTRSTVEYVGQYSSRIAAPSLPIEGEVAATVVEEPMMRAWMTHLLLHLRQADLTRHTVEARHVCEIAVQLMAKRETADLALALLKLYVSQA